MSFCEVMTTGMLARMSARKSATVTNDCLDDPIFRYAKIGLSDVDVDARYIWVTSATYQQIRRSRYQ